MPSQFIDLIYEICGSTPTPSLKFHFPADDANLVNMIVDNALFARLEMNPNTGCFWVRTTDHGEFFLNYTESAALVLGMVESARGVIFTEADQAVFQGVRDELDNRLNYNLLKNVRFN